MKNFYYKYRLYIATLLLSFGVIAVVRPYLGVAQYEVKQTLAKQSTETITVKEAHDKIANFRTSSKVTTPVKVKESASAKNSKVNSITIPSIGVDAEIVEGKTPSALYKGIWRVPTSSTPDKGGNTVITAHRYLKTSGPKTFYLLDKVQKGDKITIVWNNTTYNYTVYDTFIVTPDRVEIEDNTADSIITLYTCTPLWKNTHRLVVRAILDK